MPSGGYGVNFEMLGIRELYNVLQKLPSRMSYKIIVAAYRKSAKPVVNAARANARPFSNTIAKSIGVMVGKDKTRPTIFVGPRSKSDAYRGLVKLSSVKHDGWFAHFWEFGTEARVPRKNKFLYFLNKAGQLIRTKMVEGIKPHPFMRPAIDRNKHKVMEVFQAELAKAIDKEIQKHAKKHQWK